MAPVSRRLLAVVAAGAILATALVWLQLSPATRGTPSDGAPSSSGGSVARGTTGATAVPGSTAPRGAAPKSGASSPGPQPPRGTPGPGPGAAPTPGPTVRPPVVLPPSGHPYLLTSAGELAARPTSGAAWNNLKAVADAPAGQPDIANQDDDTDQHTFAKSLVFARTGVAAYRDQVYALLRAAVGTEAGGRTLALGRNLTGYVFAADLIDLKSFAPGWDSGVFRPWLRRVLTEPMTEGVNLVYTAKTRPNNWGTYAGASWSAAAAYLGDRAQLASAAAVFRGWLGDWNAYHGFTFEAAALTWAADPAHVVGINPAGTQLPVGGQSVSVDGVLPSDMSRGGSLAWPPGETGYVWEGLAGAYEEAEILTHQGYGAYSWSNQALRRAVAYLWYLNSKFGYWFDLGGSPLHANGWIPWLADRRYGASYPVATTRIGRGFGFTDWLYGR